MILVFVETVAGRLTALSRQMVGLALRLSSERNGDGDVIAYSYAADAPFFAKSAACAAESCVRQHAPEVVLLAATPTGKSIAPFLAAAFHTGLAADCNDFSWTADGNLLQTRPAFGGMVRASIVTAKARPQLATVRENVFPDYEGEIRARPMTIPADAEEELLSLSLLTPQEGIGRARRILAIGGGLRDKEDVFMAKEAADAIGATLACTRVLVARGWMPQTAQIGLSGSAVRPELLLTLGISGSVQFMAGASGAKSILAVDSNPQAPIFSYAELSICADLYAVLPALIKQAKA